ncbi:MAG TPA: sigma-70 family RNA polymerase sigma factor [Fimbriiglobus sp.]|jgi:RNA polymerase sigma-70 factor (ECF subfamily)|nr:sigma-70 family RNA polymerase sigma factor [Fimbriiglobus sp.]
MTPAVPQPATAPPDDPERAALDAPELRGELTAHALARLGIWLSDQPAATRADAAQEIVQETLQRAWRRRDTFDPAAGTSLAGWTHGILNHVLSEHCRALRKQPAQPPADPAGWEDLAARMDPAEDPAEVNDLLDLLPADRRQIVTLYYLNELSHREIGERLGISEVCSRVRLARALNELRRLAAGKEGGR